MIAFVDKVSKSFVDCPAMKKKVIAPTARVEYKNL
jgi:hypothetical protein